MPTSISDSLSLCWRNFSVALLVFILQMVWACQGKKWQLNAHNVLQYQCSSISKEATYFYKISQINYDFELKK